MNVLPGPAILERYIRKYVITEYVIKRLYCIKICIHTYIHNNFYQKVKVVNLHALDIPVISTIDNVSFSFPGCCHGGSKGECLGRKVLRG